MVAGTVAGDATALPYPVGMNTTKRAYLPKREWARREVARIDAELFALRDQRHPSGRWRKIRSKSAAQSRLHARRARLASIAGMGVDDGPTPF